MDPVLGESSKFGLNMLLCCHLNHELTLIAAGISPDLEISLHFLHL